MFKRSNSYLHLELKLTTSSIYIIVTYANYKLRTQLCSYGQAVKTPPSHGGIRGSSPLRSTNHFMHSISWVYFFTSKGTQCCYATQDALHLNP